MEGKEVTEEYIIVNIARYSKSVGQVSVFLVPVNPLETNRYVAKEPPLEITKCFPGGQMTMIDPKAMMDAFASAMAAEKQNHTRQDPRTLLWVMPESEFMALDWKYGTIIHLSLHKIGEPQPTISKE